MKLTDKQIENREAKMFDTKLSLKERKAAYKEIMDSQLNPLKSTDFDPDTFEPIGMPDEIKAVVTRQRKSPPRRLPTLGLKPKEIFEGQMVGMFESKQDLYLLIAWLSERVSDLEDLVNKKP